MANIKMINIRKINVTKRPSKLLKTGALSITLSLAAACLLSACAPAKTTADSTSISAMESAADGQTETTSTTKEVFAMNTYITLTAYGANSEEAVDAALEEITRLEELLSTGIDTSEISQINQNGSGSISEDTSVMIEKALEIGQQTDGRFDISIYPLMVEWGFTNNNFHVPEDTRIQELLENVDYRQIQLDRETMTLTLGPDQQIDLGGIAKGFTSDRIMEIFEEYGVSSGIVSLGGNVECLGAKTDGSLWKCGIRDPFDQTNLIGILSVQDTAVITSGAYERNFVDEETGNIYHHIMDPTTGYSADNGLVSVSIISQNGMLADALSTSLYILGLDDAINYWQEYASDFDMILMTDDQKIYITEGVADAFESDYSVNIIEKTVE